jgi:dihydroorotate dehydrogenase
MMIPAGTAVAAIPVYMMYKYLCQDPWVAFIAALTRVEDSPLTIKLTCVANHEQEKILNMKGEMKGIICCNTMITSGSIVLRGTLYL